MSQENNEHRLRAFVLMPFDTEFDAIFDKLITPTLEEVGYDVKRADSILNQQNILKDILRGIAEADLVVADLTSLNANVFYELGIAHTLLRPTVLLAQSNKDVPFDLSSYRVILYSTHFVEAPQLSKKLKEIGEKAKNNKLGFGNPVSDFLPREMESEFSRLTTDARDEIETKNEKKIENDEEEKGIWDFVVDGEKSMKDITEHSRRITEATEEVGSNMQKRTAELQKISQTGSPGTASRIHEIATASSLDIIKYAKQLEDEQPNFHSAWESFDHNISGLLQTTRIESQEDKKIALDFRMSVEQLRVGIIYALNGVKGLRESVANMKDISREINRASKRTAHILDLLISDLEGADSYCTKVLTLLDEKIAKYSFPF